MPSPSPCRLTWVLLSSPIPQCTLIPSSSPVPHLLPLFSSSVSLTSISSHINLSRRTCLHPSAHADEHQPVQCDHAQARHQPHGRGVWPSRGLLHVRSSCLLIARAFDFSHLRQQPAPIFPGRHTGVYATVHCHADSEMSWCAGTRSHRFWYKSMRLR